VSQLRASARSGSASEVPITVKIPYTPGDCKVPKENLPDADPPTPRTRVLAYLLTGYHSAFATVTRWPPGAKSFAPREADRLRPGRLPGDLVPSARTHKRSQRNWIE
jgi:hypothetical protein